MNGGEKEDKGEKKKTEERKGVKFKTEEGRRE